MAAKLKSKEGLKDYLLLLSKVEPIDPVTQRNLLLQCSAGDPVAVREMVEAFLPRVLHWVAPRRGEAFSFQELIAIGNCALIEMVKNYKGDPAKFETRACMAVHAALDTALKMGA